MISFTGDDLQEDALKQLFLKNGYRLLSTIGSLVNGERNNFFESVAESLRAIDELNSGSHVVLKEQVADFLLVNRHNRCDAEFVQTFDESCGEEMDQFDYSLDDYVKIMGGANVPLCDVAIQATAAVLNRPIFCFVETTSNWVSYEPVMRNGIQLGEPLCIAYFNDHYFGSKPLPPNEFDNSTLKVFESKYLARYELLHVEFNRVLFNFNIFCFY